MDDALLQWINQGWAQTPLQPVLDVFFSWVSQVKAFTYPLLLLILWLLIRGHGRSGWRLWLLLVVSIGLGDMIGNGLKHLIGAMRPCAEFPDTVRLVMEPFKVGCSFAPHGMPSNHALDYFVATAFLGVALRSWRWFFSIGLIAVAVATSRIYLGVHYPGQVLAGMCIGLTLGTVFALAVTRLSWFANWLRLWARNDYEGLTVRLLYSLLLYLSVPLVILRLIWRGLRNRDYWHRWSERFGYFTTPELHNPIWLHAVSVGEVQASLPLIKALRSHYPERSIVVTTMTPTGSGRVRKQLGDDVFHVYVPYDLPGAVERFIQRVKPTFAMIMETELWPNLFYQLHQQGVPLVVANARLSPKSMEGYHNLKRLTTSTLKQVDLLVAQGAGDAERFRTIGMDAEKIRQSGNIKFDLEIPASVYESSEAIGERLGRDRPIWIAASTHEGEDEQVLETFRMVREKLSKSLLILVPRHPERFSSVAALCEKAGLNVVRRTDDKHCDEYTHIFVLDTLGELLQFYAAADVAFVGGSLVETGGHNILEPAALKKPVIVGPYMFNFQEITQTMKENDAIRQVKDAEQLATVVLRLLTHSEERHQLGERGYEFVEENRGSLQRLLDFVIPIIPA